MQHEMTMRSVNAMAGTAAVSVAAGSASVLPGLDTSAVGVAAVPDAARSLGAIMTMTGEAEIIPASQGQNNSTKGIR